jgi:hypothetical protein
MYIQHFFTIHQYGLPYGALLVGYRLPMAVRKLKVCEQYDEYCKCSSVKSDKDYGIYYLYTIVPHTTQ